MTATLRGDQLRIVGAGWVPSQTLTISLSQSADGAGATPLTQARANRNGRFSVTAVLQPPPAGDFYVVVTSDAGVTVIVQVRR